VSKARLFWAIRVGARDAHADLGSLWVTLWATALIALIPIAIYTGFQWNEETELAIVTALISYPIWFLFTAGRKARQRYRNGHPYLRTQIDVTEAGSLLIWLMLKDGASPQGVNNLGLLVRRRGGKGHAVRFGPAARTISHVGSMPPHALYPDQFPDAPRVVEPGIWQVIWSDVRGGRRRDLLFAEQEIVRLSDRV
jgi:hypothetical protein